MKVSIIVRAKSDVPDAAGKTLHHLLLESGGSSDIREIRVGRYVEIDFESGDDVTITERVKRLCNDLLVNEATEEYFFRVEE